MNTHEFKVGEYSRKESEWADGWAVMAEPRRFAARFNSTVPGAFRQVTTEDIRLMAQCGLIGRHGFFTREDLEMVRGILRYEQLREYEPEDGRELEFIRQL